MIRILVKMQGKNQTVSKKQEGGGHETDKIAKMSDRWGGSKMMVSKDWLGRAKTLNQRGPRDRVPNQRDYSRWGGHP